MMVLRLFLFILIFSLSPLLAYAIVPTIDENIFGQDVSAMASYGAILGGYLSNLGTDLTAAQQIGQLHGLAQLSQAGVLVCDLCSKVQMQQLQQYVDQVNNDLCQQFAWSMQNITGIVENIQNLSQIISLLQNNPQAAGLALQQAAIQTQVAMQNTLAQIQLLMAQQAQKQLAEQKLEKQTTEAIYQGFFQSGL